MQSKEIVDRLSLKQLFTMIQRFGLKPIYKNPQKRKMATKKCLEKYLNNNGLDPCVICFETMNLKNIIITPCTHFFCDTCLIPHINKSETCPICRSNCPYTYIKKMIPVNRLFLHIKIDSESITITNNINSSHHTGPYFCMLATTIKTIAIIVNIIFVILFINLIAIVIAELTIFYSI